MTGSAPKKPKTTTGVDFGLKNLTVESEDPITMALSRDDTRIQLWDIGGHDELSHDLLKVNTAGSYLACIGVN